MLTYATTTTTTTTKTTATTTTATTSSAATAGATVATTTTTTLMAAPRATVSSEVEPSESRLAAPAVLVGVLTFQLLIWYLVHWDKHIVLYTWRVLGDSISIFVAVLVFCQYNAVVVEMFGTDLKVHFACLLVCFVLQQAVTGICAGAFSSRTELLELEQELLESRHGVALDIQQVKELNMRCFSQVCAHLTGFSAIYFFSLVMHEKWFAEEPWRYFLVLPIAFHSVRFIFHIADCLRQAIAGAGGARPWSKPLEQDEQVLWNKASRDGEHDVFALSLSWLCIMCVRYFATGVLPHPDGEDGLSGHDDLVLGAFGCFGAAAGGMALRAAAAGARVGLFEDLDDGMFLPRVLETFGQCCVFTVAWGLFFGAEYTMRSYMWDPNDIVSRIALALAASFFSLLLVCSLDKAADSDLTGKYADHILRSVIFSNKALLMGFSWERAFNLALDMLGDQKILEPFGVPDGTAELILCVIVVCTLLHTYRAHILPKVLVLEGQMRKAGEGDAEAGGEHAGGPAGKGGAEAAPSTRGFEATRSSRDYARAHPPPDRRPPQHHVGGLADVYEAFDDSLFDDAPTGCSCRNNRNRRGCALQ